MGIGSHKGAMLAAVLAGLGAGFPGMTTETYTMPRQEPDNRGRRAEKTAERLAKAEEKRKRRATKRLAHNAQDQPGRTG